MSARAGNQTIKTKEEASRLANTDTTLRRVIFCVINEMAARRAGVDFTLCVVVCTMV